MSGAVFSIVVADAKGDPWPGAAVEISAEGPGAPERRTDRHGRVDVVMSYADEPVTIRVAADGNVARQTVEAARVNAGETIFFEIPVDRPEAILTPFEMAVLGVGGAAVFFGHRQKSAFLKTTGEILLGSGVFSAIVRHGC